MAVSRQEATRNRKILQDKAVMDSEEMQRAKEFLEFSQQYISRRPCKITFVDGYVMDTRYGIIFDNDESYSWFKFLKDSGKRYPVKIEVGLLKDDDEQGREIASLMSETSTKALEGVYSGKIKVQPLNQIDIDNVLMMAERKRML